SRVSATQEGREAARGGGLQARPDGADPGDLVSLDGLGEPLDWDRAEGPNLDIALRRVQRVAGDENRAGHGRLLHTGGEMGRLAHRGVVHSEVGTDGT